MSCGHVRVIRLRGALVNLARLFSARSRLMPVCRCAVGYDPPADAHTRPARWLALVRAPTRPAPTARGLLRPGTEKNPYSLSGGDPQFPHAYLPIVDSPHLGPLSNECITFISHSLLVFLPKLSRPPQPKLHLPKGLAPRVDPSPTIGCRPTQGRSGLMAGGSVRP